MPETRYVIALAPEEGKPLSWWTGAIVAGGPESTAAFSLAAEYWTEEAAFSAAERSHLAPGFRVQPIQLHRPTQAKPRRA